MNKTITITISNIPPEAYDKISKAASDANAEIARTITEVQAKEVTVRTSYESESKN